jgi:Protein of unknown function (DUF2796)
VLLPRLLLATLLALCHAAPAAAAKPHEHGAAKLDIAVETLRVTVSLEAPLESLLGFERAPRNDAERQSVQRLQSLLKDGDQLFRFDAAAACKQLSSTVASALFSNTAAAKDAHLDLDASWEFSCTQAPQTVDTTLFASFTRLQRLELQVVAPRLQRKFTLKRPATQVRLRP